MRGDAATGMKDFESSGGEAHVDFAAHERVRHAVEVPVNLDVVIEVDSRPLPLGVFIR